MKTTTRIVSLVMAILLAQASAFAAGRVVRGTATTSVNRSVTVNRNVNVNRNVYVNRGVSVHGGYYGGYRGGYYGGYGCCYHPVATAAAVTAAAVVTAAVVGSIVYSIPPSCTSVVVNGFAYQQCGSTWYQPQFAGTTTTYVVVNPPR
ncbi:MAG TPA: hypothetical protein VFK70_18140 [Vicinamibacteria bacterium]|nr:hypothetical protein [Vicinamibacteria bacterium]